METRKKNQTLNERQQEELSTCMPSCRNLVYPTMGLIEEVGELCEKMHQFIQFKEDSSTEEVQDCISLLTDMEYLGRKAKQIAKKQRHSDSVPLFKERNDIDLDEYISLRRGLISEAGDIHWMLSLLLDILGASAQDCANANYFKLNMRNQQGTIDGNGDDERTKIE